MLSEANRVGLLRLVFDDITQDRHAAVVHASPVQLKSWTLWRAVGAGRSVPDSLRRGAVGIPGRRGGAVCIYYGDDGQWFELDFPNRLVYDVLVATHAQRQEPRAT